MYFHLISICYIAFKKREYFGLLKKLQIKWLEFATFYMTFSAMWMWLCGDGGSASSSVVSIRIIFSCGLSVTSVAVL